MMSIFEKVKSFLITSLLVVSGDANAVEPFNRHYIIVVDQTIKDTNPNMDGIYNGLYDWLNGENPSKWLDKVSTIPTSVGFDIRHDAISLFAFGLPGDGNPMKSEYKRIHTECYNKSKDAEYVFKDIVNSLIKRRNRYINGTLVSTNDEDRSSEKLSVFLSKEMRKLFDFTDPLHERISNESGITMSHFVYPFIMNFISKEETANEYYLILVSDFKHGVYSNNDGDDWNTLGSMTAKTIDNHYYYDYIEKQIITMRNPFVQADYLYFQKGDIKAKGTRIVMKSFIQKPQIFLSSSLTLSQSSGSVFKVSPARIEFDKDPLTTIDSIQIVLSENGNVLCRETIEKGDEAIASLIGKSREYEIPSQKIDLGKESLDDITIDYVLYTMSHDESGNPVLPVALTATQNISKDDISMINKELRKMMTIIISVLLAVAAMVILILRGRKKSLEAQVGSFAQKYMNVTEKEGAVELPCWFYHEGENTKSIRVNGSLKKKGLSIGGNVKVFARLQDGKPEGFRYYIDTKNAANFVEVKRDGYKVSFNINIEMLPEKVNPAELSTCKVKLDFMIESRIFGLFPHQDVVEDIDEIEFYFMNDLGTAWVGFDPGTTGSCVSYGCTGGSLDDPNIKMVTIKDGVRMSEIIPSKLIPKQNNFFNKTFEQLSPGDDYIYGKDAEDNWLAAIKSGEPCFQSIKKLLGYKNSADDMIEVKWGSNTRKLTGLQLAHLLVKGLKKELDDNVRALSQTDAIRYVGKSGRARRAVVAIPNNYTLPKITDMVNSVRMLGTFDEVRYIYEAEGILFNYFRKNYKAQRSGKETIVVYDMGGATINLSVFRVNYIEKSGTIYYDVHTLGRIGYAVGGDNVDVAVMEYIFTLLPQLRNSEKLRHEYQLNNKTEILRRVEGLKIDIVKGKNLENNQINNQATFYSFLRNLFSSIGMERYLSDVKVVNPYAPDSFAQAITKSICDSEMMKKYVLANVEDAVEEILKYPVVSELSKVDTLIFAGRTTMFPGIKEKIINSLSQKFKKITVYEGFNDDEIKTSVSYGACWYGIYNSLVTLDNSRLASAYGFKLTQGGSSRLNVLLNQNDSYDENGMVSNDIQLSNHFDADGNVVDFYQVMGSGKGENLFSENNRHKVNYIGSIDVTTTTSEIGMSIDRRNVVTCKVTFDTGDVSQYKDLHVVGRDITKENDWAYVFAVTPQTKSSAPTQAEQIRTIPPTYTPQPIPRVDEPAIRSTSGGAKRV